LLSRPVIAFAWSTGYCGHRLVLALRNGHTVLFKHHPIKHGDSHRDHYRHGHDRTGVEVIDVGRAGGGLIRSFGKDKDGNPIDYGSIVEEGTILARSTNQFTPPTFLAKAPGGAGPGRRIGRLRDVEQMKAKAARAEADWKRAQELSRSKLISQA